MRAYACYFLDLNSDIERVEIIEAETDADAMEQAEALFAAADGLFRAVELWDQARRVRQVGSSEVDPRESPEQIQLGRRFSTDARH